MQRTSQNLLSNPPNNQHIAIVYESNEELNSAVSQYLNEGLSKGQLCVYSTVHFRDAGYIEKFSSLIANYKENVENGSLLIVDLAPFYISSLLGDIKPFEDAKQLLAEKVRDRKDKHVRFVGDGTGFLFKNRHFDECAMIERWWQEKPFGGSYVCPFPKQFFNSYPHDIYSKRAVVSTHDIVVNVSDGSVYSPKADGLGELQEQSNSEMAQQIQGHNSDKNPGESGGDTK